jgi:hypothetical protein
VFGQNVTEHNPAPSPSGHSLLSGPPTLDDFTRYSSNFRKASRARSLGTWRAVAPSDCEQILPLRRLAQQQLRKRQHCMSFTPLRLNITLPCAAKHAPPSQEALYDCYLSASITGVPQRPWQVAWPQHPWQVATRQALKFLQPKRAAKGKHTGGDEVGPPAQAMAPMRARGAIEKVFSAVKRWHLTTQERLYGQLRSFWPDDTPRVMVDLGCHAGHGPNRNTSDALIFFDFWNAPGTTVVGVDAFEDFAQDLQHRPVQHDLTPPLAAPCPGSCAPSGRAWRYCATMHWAPSHCLG